jgi:hypothetical protein
MVWVHSKEMDNAFALSWALGTLELEELALMELDLNGQEGGADPCNSRTQN